MEKIYKSVTELIGKTPLLEAVNIEKKYDLKARLLLKLEYLNPAGSVKDRAAYEIICQAEADGRLQPGGTIIEPTSGNTGIGLASIAAAKGYELIIVLPETMSVERRNIIKAYGAKIVLSDGAKGMSGAIEKANELNAQILGSIIAGQFDNQANPAAHRKTTGPEIWEDTDGKIDAFVATIGTGGTITGTGEYLKSQSDKIQVIGVEPESSAVLSGKPAGAHQIQGIGAGFVPTVLNTKVYDEILPISNEDSFEYGKMIATTEGIQVGISSGAALAAAICVAQRPQMEGKTIVVLLPDSGDRYYSTELFAD